MYLWLKYESINNYKSFWTDRSWAPVWMTESLIVFLSLEEVYSSFQVRTSENFYHHILFLSVGWGYVLRPPAAEPEEPGRPKGKVYIFNIYKIDSKMFQIDRLKTLGRVHYTKHSIYLWNTQGCIWPDKILRLWAHSFSKIAPEIFSVRPLIYSVWHKLKFDGRARGTYSKKLVAWRKS